MLILILLVSTTVNSMECEYGIEPKFQYATKFIDGAALVSCDGNSAVVDKFGKITDYNSPAIKMRSNGLVMVVGENDLAAFFDKNGFQLTEYVYDTFPVTDPKTNYKTYRFGYYDGDGKSDLVPFSRGKKYGYINSKGEEVIPPRYEYAYGFVNGMALICADGILSEYGTYTNGKYGYILETGYEVLPPDSFWIADNNSEYGYIIFSNGEAGKTLADVNGNVVEADEFGYAAIDAPYIKLTTKDGKTGIKDNKGNVIVPIDDYSFVEYVGNDLFVINRNKITDNKFKTIFEAASDEKLYVHFINIYDRSSLIRIEKGTNLWEKKYGFVTSEGEVIVPPEYDTLYDLNEGLIYGSKSGKNYLIDYRGKVICEINSNNCGESLDGIFPASDVSSGKYGYLLNPLRYPKVYVNEKKITSDVYPRIENDRTLIPMRAVFEALDAEVMWDDTTRTVTASRNGNEIVLKIGSNILYKNGEPVEIDVPARIENDRTLVPLRAVSESLDCVVEWDEENRAVYIKTTDV